MGTGMKYMLFVDNSLPGSYRQFSLVPTRLEKGQEKRTSYHNHYEKACVTHTHTHTHTHTLH